MKKILVIFTFIAFASCEVLQSDVFRETYFDAFIDHIMRQKNITDIKPSFDSATKATLGQFPYQVGMVFENEEYSIPCTGVLVKHKWVLTAAICAVLGNFANFKIVLGTVDLSSSPEWSSDVISASNIHIHPNIGIFDPEYPDITLLKNDIALIYVKNMPNITNSQNIGTIDLPTDADMNLYLEGKSAITSGYAEKDLHYSTTTIVSLDVCDYGNIPPKSFWCTKTFTGSNCILDFGAPLTVQVSNNRSILVGVAGMPMRECYPGPIIYENVLYHREWIKKTINGSEMFKINFMVIFAVFVAVLRNLP